MHKEAAEAAGRHGVHVTEDGVGWGLEVVLDDLAAKVAIERIPDLAVAVEFGIDVPGQVGFCAIQRRLGLNVAAGGVQVDEVGLEVDQSLRVVHGILIEAAVF